MYILKLLFVLGRMHSGSEKLSQSIFKALHKRSRAQRRAVRRGAMLFPSSSAAAPLLALLLLLAAVSPPGAALELPSPLADVAVGAEPGSAEALPMNAPQTEVRGRANARENRCREETK